MVQINAKLNIIQYAALWTGSGCMRTLVGVHNSNSFSSESVVFPVRTLKFVGASATVQSVGSTREYFVNYTFLWRPNGWFRQELTLAGATAGFFKTNNVDGGFPEASYAGKFPTS